MEITLNSGHPKLQHCAEIPHFLCIFKNKSGHQLLARHEFTIDRDTNL